MCSVEEAGLRRRFTDNAKKGEKRRKKERKRKRQSQVRRRSVLIAARFTCRRRHVIAVIAADPGPSPDRAVVVGLAKEGLVFINVCACGPVAPDYAGPL